jgi:hypothetical protein
LAFDEPILCLRIAVALHKYINTIQREGPMPFQ